MSFLNKALSCAICTYPCTVLRGTRGCVFPSVCTDELLGSPAVAGGCRVPAGVSLPASPGTACPRRKESAGKTGPWALGEPSELGPRPAGLGTVSDARLC